MGKPTGFLEFTRELPSKRLPEERVADYKEFIERYSDEKLNQQSARCMDCGIPFCHNGCPLGNVIPEFNDAVYRKSWKEAYDILSSTNNFPEFTGRICPAPCETACVLGINQPAIAIEEIEKHIIEIAFDKGYVQADKQIVRTGKKVAVIGSGPAGLAAAAQLNIVGHSVTVFERDDLPGGLLRYGIPDFKLEKWVIDRRVKLMEEEGVVFKCNANVGVDISISNLLREYQAIVLAGGSTVPRNLDIPGRDLKGVYFAMQFLKQQNKRVAGSSFSEEPIMATGKNVIVIGGGDTGSDCVGTSNRHKAASVTQFELMPKPPSQRNTAMPWPSYPMLLKTTSSHEEGCDNKPAQFVEVKGSERKVPCELAFLAMGFVHPQQEGMISELEVELDERGNVRASEKNYQSNIARVFTAGDMRRGQSLVVWAIKEGRDCAQKVDEFLMGQSLLETADRNAIARYL